jgi:hypothetical protein
VLGEQENKMVNVNLLIVAMAVQCQDTILASRVRDIDLPKSLQPNHLLWMCRKIQEHADDWHANRLNRWIGYVQCAMLAHRMIGLDEAKAMFDKAKAAHGDAGEDLMDHLDPTSDFEFEIGGQG